MYCDKMKILKIIIYWFNRRIHSWRKFSRNALPKSSVNHGCSDIFVFFTKRCGKKSTIFRKFETSHIAITKVEFYKLSNLKNFLIFETQLLQKFDYFFLSLSIMEIR